MPTQSQPSPSSSSSPGKDKGLDLSPEETELVEKWKRSIADSDPLELSQDDDDDEDEDRTLSKDSRVPPAQQHEHPEKHLLIDDEGNITQEFEDVLSHIFRTFSSSCSAKPSSDRQGRTEVEKGVRPSKSAILTESDLDRFATLTNGSPLSQESKQEIADLLDTDQQGNLTFEGFLSMYTLQSDNEPQETFKDLQKLGFDSRLNPIHTSVQN
ncbi:hypothetical protein IE53DRAFT_383065 [Violaceomyces palustris]|uniref:Uncharacterized protein n=1 Tax=Violaceomyces palustris TaxID=1673888 RepID=A0ACD0P8T5_9BASI|nr:hypothetical protein IE53DRAFT_383065 [Violaceomyces palustris]